MVKIRNFFREKVHTLWLAVFTGLFSGIFTGGVVYRILIALVVYIVFIRVVYGEWFYTTGSDK
jgi:hypothetical protein